jgi:hypothetical protein
VRVTAARRSHEARQQRHETGQYVGTEALECLIHRDGLDERGVEQSAQLPGELRLRGTEVRHRPAHRGDRVDARLARPRQPLGEDGEVDAEHRRRRVRLVRRYVDELVHDVEGAVHVVVHVAVMASRRSSRASARYCASISSGESSARRGGFFRVARFGTRGP